MSQESSGLAPQESVPDVCLEGAVQLDGSDLAEHLVGLPRWSVEAGRLRRVLHFESFGRSFTFATAVALLAERENHHPTVTVDKRDVELVLWTRKLSAITTVDVAFAEAIERLVEEHL